MSKRVTKRPRRPLRRRARRWAGALVVMLVLGAGIRYLASTYGLGGVAEIGERAPGFVLDDANGQRISLGDYAGRPVVLVFYMNYG